jgi:hypothetical protein
LGLQSRKIDNPADAILLITGDKKVGNIVMTVEVLALATMLVEPMTSTEFNATHDN